MLDEQKKLVQEQHRLERVNKYPKSSKYGRQNPISEQWNSEEQLLHWHERWAYYVNRELEGCELEERIDHRSHKDRNLLEQPTIHEGVVAIAMERKGFVSERCEFNRYIAFRPTAELSHLQEQEQYDLLMTIESEDATPSLSQAIRLKQLSQDGKLDMDTIFDIMSEEKPNQKETVKIQREKLDKYFGRNVSVSQIEATILRLLENERIRQLKKRSEREDR